jgi:hypothetical protein
MFPNPAQSFPSKPNHNANVPFLSPRIGQRENKNNAESDQLQQLIASALKIGTLCSGIARMLPCGSAWKKPLNEAGRLFCFFPALNHTRALADLFFLRPRHPLTTYLNSTVALVTVTHFLLGTTSKLIDTCCRKVLDVAAPAVTLYSAYKQWNPASLAHIALILSSGLQLYAQLRPVQPHVYYLIGGCTIAGVWLSSNSNLGSSSLSGCC